MITENDLSDEQKIVYNFVLKWVDDKTNKLLTFGGVAGSGKSTLTSLLAKKINKSIAFAAFTGKAANVLRQKLDENKVLYSYCGTIHGLIYSPIIDKISLRVIGWRKRPKIDEELIFIDEASMLNDRMFFDLQRYGKKILAIGDHAQLPPIGSDISLMESPNLKLEETHRAAKGNPIISLSTMIRHEEDISDFVSADNRVRFLNRNSDELGEFAVNMYKEKETRLNSVILCYFNKSRILYNTVIRKALNLKEEPEIGDVVICLKNVPLDKDIFNGMRGFVESSTSLKNHIFNMNIDFVDEKIKINEKVFKYQFNEEQTMKSPLDAKVFGVNVKSWDKLGLLFDYGYALTVHKSQGSSFENVIVFVERSKYQSDDDFKRWLYTAVTRASKNLVLVY